jgi:hypothetical protein
MSCRGLLFLALALVFSDARSEWLGSTINGYEKDKNSFSKDRVYYRGLLGYSEIYGALKVPESCDTEVVEILKNLEDYARVAEDSKSFKAKRLFKKIQSRLKKSLQSKDGCFEIMGQAYALGSLGMTSDPNDRSVKLGYLLWSHSRLQMLTPKTREDLGPLFTTKIKKGSRSVYKVYGAYDCQTNRVYLDPTHPPLDMGGIFLHELSHFVRDKSEYDPLPGLKDSVLLDEVISATLAAFMQKKLRTGLRRNRMPFKISGDLTLYRPKGDFVSLLKGLGALSNNEWSSYEKMMGQSFLNPQQMASSRGLGHVQNIYSKYFKAYFGRALDESSWQEFLSQFRAHDAEVRDPFVNWISDVGRGQSTDESDRQFLLKLEKTLEEPSSSCQRLQLGSEGVRPTFQSVKPCLHIPDGL